jgi:hypothetical protein
MGWPQCDDGRFDTSKQRIDYLISLGLDPEVASFISFTSKNMAQLVRVLALMNASLNGLRVFTRLLGSRLETLRHTELEREVDVRGASWGVLFSVVSMSVPCRLSGGVV